MPVGGGSVDDTLSQSILSFVLDLNLVRYIFKGGQISVINLYILIDTLRPHPFFLIYYLYILRVLIYATNVPYEFLKIDFLLIYIVKM